MDDVILQVRDLNFHYEDFHALKDINIDFGEKTVTSLIGPSGCGKSTFLRTINRMNDVIEGIRVEGSVFFDGKDVYREHDIIELRMRIGMVFQKPNPFPMSIFDNVAYGPRLHGNYSKKQLSEIVERSLQGAAVWDEVKDSLHKSAFSLSGGQQQRICIARALAVEPEIVLMDEPTSALDPISTARIEDLIDELKKKYTIIIVTHNMQQAGRISDITAFFLHGVIEEAGSTEQIFFNPKNAKTEAYLSGKFG